MLAAELLLIETLLHEFLGRRRSQKYMAAYKPFPLPDTKNGGGSFEQPRVSVIVPTVDWDEPSFMKALCSWLRNGPSELIVVTTFDAMDAARALLDSEEVQRCVSEDGSGNKTHLKVRGVEQANKRDQLLEGINSAGAPILALVDDDAIWEPTTLRYLLAPFDNPDVGLVGGPVESYMPEERKDPAVITAWEVAALRNRSRRRGGNKAFFVADGSTNFTISGATMLVRGSIVRDADFPVAFANERFLGVRQNSGDDSFITRWVLFHHLRPDGREWKLGMQLVPEARVSTTLMTDSRFAGQMKRWMRTGLRFRLTCLLIDPGYWNPILTLLWWVAFALTVQRRPRWAIALAAWYIYGTVSSLRSFCREFPYCRSKVWAAFLADKVPLISDWYSWATLPTERWYSRKTVDTGPEPAP
ncbi:nucleotide-diphospho-sugar transferase [Xylariaceae sp. FL0594]|nr:nucleotide-diphospho-sugar transferase [Xylariaceae sp. FL0594]